MFNKTNLFIIAALAGLVAQSAEAIIVRAEVWRKQRQDGSYQYVLAASDAHHTNLISNPEFQEKLNLSLLHGDMKAQCDTLINVVSKVPQSQLKIIIEDSSTHVDGTWAVPFPESAMSESGQLLHRFAYECKAQGIGLANVEVRQKRIGAHNFAASYAVYDQNMKYAEELKKLCESEEILAQYGEQQIAQWKAEYAVRVNIKEQIGKLNVLMGDIIDDYKDIITEIKKYTDGEQLCSYYLSELDRIHIPQPSHKILQQMKLKHKNTFQEFVDSLKENRASMRFASGISNYFLFYGMALLDMKALHAIHQAFVDDKKDALVFMGGAHIHNICTVLHRLGYEKVEEVGCDSAIDYLGANGTGIDGMVTALSLIKATKAISYDKLSEIFQQPLVNVDVFAKYLPIIASNQSDGGLLK